MLPQVLVMALPALPRMIQALPLGKLLWALGRLAGELAGYPRLEASLLAI